MDLILWRHADAEDARGGDDLCRALSARGRSQAERMAAWLGPRLPAGARVIASPALRCQETVAALGRATTTVASIAPGASGEAVLAAAGWPAEAGAVVVVGHQPTLGLAAAIALGESASPRGLDKGAVCWLRGGPGEGEARIHASRSPDDDA